VCAGWLAGWCNLIGSSSILIIHLVGNYVSGVHFLIFSKEESKLERIFCKRLDCGSC